MKGRIGKLEDDSKRRNKLEERYKKREYDKILGLDV